VGIISQSIGGRKLCAPTVTDFVHNVGANCVRPKGTLSKRKSLNATSVPEPSSLLGFITLGGLMLGGAVRLTGGGSDT
jgi:hypothetical protein